MAHFGVHRAGENGFALRFLFVLRSGRRRQELLPTVVAAKIRHLSSAFCVESGCFVHCHSADGVFGHINSLSCVCLDGLIPAIWARAGLSMN